MPATKSNPLPPPVTQPTPPRPPRHRRSPRSRSRTAAAVVAVALGWLLVVWAAPKIQVGPGLAELARFGHLAALVVGFGAVLTVEWFGLMWLLRRRPLSAVVQVAQGAHTPIWLGLAGLALTGMVLAPEQLTMPGTLKLGVVLVVALNGVYAARVQRLLSASAPTPPRQVLTRVGITAMVSQLGWWTAVIIGFLSSHD